MRLSDRVEGILDARQRCPGSLPHDEECHTRYRVPTSRRLTTNSRIVSRETGALASGSVSRETGALALAVFHVKRCGDAHVISPWGNVAKMPAPQASVAHSSRRPRRPTGPPCEIHAIGKWTACPTSRPPQQRHRGNVPPSSRNTRACGWGRLGWTLGSTPVGNEPREM